MGSNKLVIFDLCETLYDSNTTFDFLDFYLNSNQKYSYFRKLTKFKIWKLINLISIKIFNYDITRTIAISFLKNISKLSLVNFFQEFYSYLETKKINISHNLLDKAIQEKSTVYIISASLDFIVEEIVIKLGIENYCSSKLEYKNEFCTGLLERDLLGSKNEIISRIIKKYDFTTFITDNKSDINCINLVDNFIVISKEKNMNFWKKQKNISQIYEI